MVIEKENADLLVEFLVEKITELLLILTHCLPLLQVLKSLVSSDVQENLLVADTKLGNAIKDKLSVSCISNSNVHELMRCIRTQADSLLGGLPKKELTAMALGMI